MNKEFSRRTLLGGGAALLGVAMSGTSAFAIPSGWQEHPRLLYKSVGSEELYLHRWGPSDFTGEKPAIVFYHGGAWRLGRWFQYEWLGKYFAARGVQTFSVEYRLEGPIAATEDAIDAMNYVFAHAQELGVDTSHVAAVGGSAGGHLASATGTLTLSNTRHAHRPTAIALLNPVTDTTSNFPEGYGRNQFNDLDTATRFSPYHHVGEQTSPTLIMHGTSDQTVHVANSVAFIEAMRGAGNDARLITYEGQPHGFFNWKSRYHNSYAYETGRQLDLFLTSLGFLSDHPTLRPPPEQLLDNPHFDEGVHGWSQGDGTRLRRTSSGGIRVDQDSVDGGLICDVTDVLQEMGRGAYFMRTEIVADPDVTVRLGLEVRDSYSQEVRRLDVSPAAASGQIAGTRVVSWLGRIESARLLVSGVGPSSFEVTQVSLEFLPATVMRFTMDQLRDGVLKDGSGYDNDSVVRHAPLVEGRTGSALKFDGERSCIELKQLGRSPMLGFAVRMSLFLEGDGGFDQVLLDRTGGDRPWLYLDGASKRLVSTLGEVIVMNSTRIRGGRWTDVLLTIDQDEVRLYVDEQVASASGAADLEEGMLWLGLPEQATPNRRGWHGRVDEVEIHDFPMEHDSRASNLSIRPDVPEFLLAGGEFTLSVSIINRGDEAVRNLDLRMEVPASWTAEPLTEVPTILEGGEVGQAQYRVTVARDARVGRFRGRAVASYEIGDHSTSHPHSFAIDLPEVFDSLPATFNNVATTDDAGTVIGALRGSW